MRLSDQPKVMQANDFASGNARNHSNSEIQALEVTAVS